VLARLPSLIPLYYTISALMLAWNVMAAGRIIAVPAAPRRFATLSAMAGLLSRPQPSSPSRLQHHIRARAAAGGLDMAVHDLLFVVQALYATSRRLVNPIFGVPIVLYDMVIAAVAISKYIALRGGTPPPAVLALAAAQANALGIVFGSAALWKTYLQVPLLAPALACALADHRTRSSGAGNTRDDRDRARIDRDPGRCQRSPQLLALCHAAAAGTP
jgi:hypothetical protein